MLKSQALKILEEKIIKCNRCSELSEYRKTNNYKYVPGAGNPSSKLMFIGEAPGENEAINGLPFVGKAGRLLDNIIKTAGWKREEVFISNTVKCRPPKNRDPLKEEADKCRQFLNMQIKIVQPEWIICLGRIASVFLLNKEETTTIGELRGSVHQLGEIKVICTYHPSYLLRNESAKQDLWEDIQIVISSLKT